MKRLRVTHLLIPALALLLLALAILLHNPTVSADPGATELVSGTYDGSVTVSEPAPLGALALQLDINSANGALSGQVNPIKTQVFLGGPTFTGQVTVTQGLTPTVRIESQLFSGTVSGRTVQRRFVLTGAVLDDGNGLRGDYTETILGFTAQPMLIKGKFLLTRPNGLARIVTVPAPNGSTPTSTPTQPAPGDPPTLTPTATATVPSGNGTNRRLYLPLISKQAAGAGVAAVDGSVAAQSATGVPTLTSTATPTPAATLAAPLAPALSSRTDITINAPYLPTVVAESATSQLFYLPLISR